MYRSSTKSFSPQGYPITAEVVWPRYTSVLWPSAKPLTYDRVSPGSQSLQFPCMVDGRSLFPRFIRIPKSSQQPSLTYVILLPTPSLIRRTSLRPPHPRTLVKHKYVQREREYILVLVLPECECDGGKSLTEITTGSPSAPPMTPCSHRYLSLRTISSPTPAPTHLKLPLPHNLKMRPTNSTNAKR